MERVKIKKTLDINYVDLFSKEWTEVLNPLLSSPYMFNLMAFIQEIYGLLPNDHEGNEFVFPKKNRLFDNFRSCPYDGLRVVIIGKEPYANSTNATGIPFALPPIGSNSKLEKELELIEKCIYKSVKKHSDDKYLFDETMYSWTYQGVLLLDAASTSEEGTEMAHANYWRNFTREVVKLISKNNKDIVFMMWGEEAQYFTKFIDRDKHHVLINNHPQDAMKLNAEWTCPHFNQANKIFEKIDGANTQIYW